jgi:hypothetical protein
LEERSLIAARVKTSPIRFRTLFQVMIKDRLSSDKKVDQLKRELGYHHKTNSFNHCKTMGDIVLANIKLLLAKDFKQSIII